jgi:hypothetical protein
MVSKQMNDLGQYGADETVARREAALKRMLSTPHKPHAPVRKKAKRPARKRSASKPDNA